MSAPSPDLFELLLNEKNIVGAWAVIVALITLFGIFINNFFENLRKNKERRHALIRDAYVGALEYLASSYHQILQIGNGQAPNMGAGSTAYTEKFYKVLFVATPSVIEVVTNVSLKYSNVVTKLSEHLLDANKYHEDIVGYQTQIEMSVKRMNSITQDMRAYNDKEKIQPELWDILDKQFKNVSEDFELQQRNKDIALKAEMEAKIILLKESIAASLEISPFVYDAIISMRADIERKLSRGDTKKIHIIFDNMIENLKKDSDFFIERLKFKLKEYESR